MDANFIFAALVLFSCASFLFTALRSPLQKPWGWILKLTGIIFALGFLWFTKRHAAGYASAATWFLFVIAPVLVHRRAQRLAVAKRFSASARLMSLARWLHPFDGWWQLPDLHASMAASQRGDAETAKRLLERHRHTNNPLRYVARCIYLMSLGNYESVVSWIEDLYSRNEATRDVGLRVLYLRALGEVGQLEELVKRAVLLIPRLPRGSISRANTELALFAFCGELEAVAILLDSRLRLMDSQTKSFWRATALFASGRGDDARVALEAARVSPDVMLQRMIDTRSNAPPKEAAPILGERAALVRGLAEESVRAQADEPRRSVYRAARATYVLAVISIAMFAVEMLLGGSTNPTTLVRMGAVVSDLVFAGEAWRLLVACFLHFGGLHLALNMAGLVFIGSLVEYRVGRLRLILLYAVSGMGAMLTVAAIAQMSDRPILLVGGSGGVMGLLGAMGALMFINYRKTRSRTAWARLERIAMIVVFQAIFDFVTPQVSGLAHLSGAVIGAVLAFLVSARSTNG